MQRELDDQRQQAIRAKTQLEENVKAMREQKALLEASGHTVTEKPSG